MQNHIKLIQDILKESFPNDISFFLGIAGGTASGKTSIAKQIVDLIGREHINIISTDRYYLPKDEQKTQGNYDHPEAIDFHSLKAHLQTLKAQKPIYIPDYDFTKHDRTDKLNEILPKPITIVEGHLLFHYEYIRKLLNLMCFVDTDPSERYIRRFKRDKNERGRDEESIYKQWRETVQPMHNEFVEPTKNFAHFIIPSRYGEGYSKVVSILTTFLISWDSYIKINHKN